MSKFTPGTRVEQNRSEVNIQQMIGGGDSYYYAIKDGKVIGSAHRYDKDAMQRLINMRDEKCPVYIEWRDVAEIYKSRMNTREQQ